MFPAGTIGNIDFGLTAFAEENTAEGYTNGFCDKYELKEDGSWGLIDENDNCTHTDCNGYQPATLNGSNYEIGNAGQLYWFADKVNNENATYGSANAVLTDNITVNTGNVANCGGTKQTGWKDWTPIGWYDNANSVDYYYSGTFDGNAKTISGLYYNVISGDYIFVAGLFGRNNGTIKNVRVADSYFKINFNGGGCFVGGVSGVNAAPGTIENCYNEGTITVMGTSTEFVTVGGVSGSGNGTIKNSHNKGKVTVTASKKSYVGGVKGKNTSTIENCSNTGEVSGIENVGGVCGYNYANSGSSKIESCSNTGTVSGTYSVGGVCGNNYATSGGTVTITNCYNTGTVSGTSYVGGVCGFHSPVSNNIAKIENSYSTGAVSGTSSVGGVCGAGYDDNISGITNCYYLSGTAEGGIEGADNEANNVVSKTAGEFGNGSVCYLLNGGITNGSQVWYQLLETETYPNLDSTNSANRTVYQCTPCTVVFSNTEGQTAEHSCVVDTNDSTKHICENCGDTHDAVFTANDETNTISVCCGLGSITLKAPTELTYDGTAKAATVEGELTGFDTPDIVYDGDSTTAPKNAGDHTASITYTISGTNYSVSVEYTIGKASVTVTAKNYTVKFGNPLPESLEYETTDLIGTDTLESIGANVTIGYVNAVTPSAIGNYIIVVSGAENTTNYELTYENGKLTIIEKPAQTITANDITLSYGDTGKKIGATTSGDGAITYAVASGDDVNRVAADGTITALKPGTATVEITAAETFDYAMATKTVTVTVNKAAVNITADSYTIKVGDTLPTFDYKVTGLVNNETLPVTVTISCAAANSDNAGSFPIRVSGADESANYTFNYVNGTLSITAKKVQTITADDVTLTYGETGKKIGATTNGDGAITYSVKTGSDIISVAADGAITVLKAGTATVEITAAETDDYAAATKTVSVTVNKKKVAVPTADSTEYTYNGTAQTYGVVSTDDYTVTGGTQTGAGNYPITITLNNENFEWDGVLGTYTFVIKRAAVTITADSYTIKVGDTLPTFDYKVTGLVNNESLPITVTVSCAAADSKTAGTFPIKVSGAAESTNYTFTYVDGKLSITAKNVQTITAADVTLTYGDAGKKISAATNGDGTISYSVKTGSDVITVAADGTITVLKAGTATVEITAAETEDYAAATKTVTVTVNKAAVTIKADDKTVYQNAALPAFTYSVTGLANGDTLSFTPVLTCEATTTSTVGTYAITVTIEITEDECYAYTTQNGTLTVQKKSSGGGSSGGSSGGSTGGSTGGSSGGGSSRPTTPPTTNPSIGGSSKSWSDVAADLRKLTNGSEATIELNGNTTVPVDVIKSIADKDSKVTLAIDNIFKWVVDGSKITTPAAADLTLIKTASTKHDGLSGVEGTQFKINGTNIPTDLMIAFKKEHAGKFANLYKDVSGKPVFVTCAKLGEDGKVILPDVVDKGDYVVMLCEFSDRLGDMDNDGVMNAKDGSAILKDIVGIEPGKNPLMADFNGDGKVNAMDASAILKMIVGLA